jgi:glycosyltransferase involved in cell wall biosynthesis
MRIAQLASNVEQVPPLGYGGTELVVSNLADELVRRGHQVTLFASGDSKTSARLESVTKRALRLAHELDRRWSAYEIRTLLRLHEMREQFDIVHNHMGWLALPFLADLGLPVLTTNHNPIKPYCAPIYLEYANLPYVAISEAYKRLNYPSELNYVATVYNGIDVERFNKNGKNKRDYLLFIGRLCEDKGTRQAIEIARRLHVPIILAGKVDATDQDYFEKQIRPQLNARDVRFVGEVNHRQKVDLYNHAIATLYPVNFEEPFGLVMAESLASGTPVMAFDRGSVREVLSDGETAIIGKSVDDLVGKFDQLKEIDADRCRERVKAMFSKQRMVDAYEDLYRRLVAQWPAVLQAKGARDAAASANRPARKHA